MSGRNFGNGQEAPGEPCPELGAVTPELGHQPHVSMETAAHEVWLSLVVGFGAGEERGSREGKGRKQRSSVNTSSEANDCCLELEGKPTCVGNSLEG